MTGSISFEHAAGFYERTRGGLDRGARFAPAMAPFLRPASRVLEIGVGTGAIAAPVRDLGHTVLGVDLAPAMLTLAFERLGPRVAVADATHLPVATGTCDTVVANWVFHLIADQEAAMAEIARVLRREGRLLVGAGAIESDDDMAGIRRGLNLALGRDRDSVGRIDHLAAAACFVRVETVLTDPHEFDESPEAGAQQLERREWSACWNLDDVAWARHVQPLIDRLRQLPDPRTPRRRVLRHQIHVYERR